MKDYVLFGAGEYGKRAVAFFSKENIAYILDNDVNKRGKSLDGVIVRLFDEMKKEIGDKRIIITVSEDKSEAIANQLRREGITNFCEFESMRRDIIKEQISHRTDYVSVYRQAIDWIKNHCVAGNAIINNTDLPKAYPEVTGYYIPSLLRWGHRETAISFAKWLCSIQKSDGSWCDTDDKLPYIFDTAQILKGLLAVERLLPEVKPHIQRGCEWVLGNMQDDGRLPSPRKDDFGDGSTFSELIHIYCLSPLVEASELLGRKDYKDKAYKIMDYYIKNYHDKIVNFSLLSHFHAYVIEGLLDMGKRDLAVQAMDNVSRYQTTEGAVPAYNDAHWICSTGLFQYALIWYRLGNIERGNKAFEYACKLQNPSGGWYGSYLDSYRAQDKNTYFPTSEISWAVKYFLDALYWKNKASFEEQASSFKNSLSLTDGRYRIIEMCVRRQMQQRNVTISVADIGCGKGAYLKNLAEVAPHNKYAGVDLSNSVLEYIDHPDIEKYQGSLTNIPFDNETFDVVFACESLEHAVDIENSVKEMARVTRKGGTVIIIDKNKDMLGYYEIDEAEQWFDKDELKEIMLRYCESVRVETEIDYEKPSNGLFYAYIGQRN